ncbi:GMC oxidoreductase [Chondromyces apiculatus]|uniref:Choline dehydrogenase n=1 Tax=Chondromyces apiculatus DSM 436 TaxID=1192034 RepID=A0A017TEL8_9BACT|nr:GMC oxidoreductase [Chondromyces apiculatus]EYF07270.1 Choline dehydrogenase [Chondromyces apiculatus DSM 436]
MGNIAKIENAGLLQNEFTEAAVSWVSPIEREREKALREQLATFWARATGAPRDVYDTFVAGSPLTDDVTLEEVDTDAVHGWWVRPREATPGEAILYIHGGGYVQGNARAYRGFVSQIVSRRGVPAFVIDYPLAPEATLPAAPAAALRAWGYMVQSGCDRIAIVGDSAGGGLSLVTLSALTKASRGPKPIAGVVFSPWVDLAFTGRSMTDPAVVDPLIGHDYLQDCALKYRGALAATDSMASPLHGDLTGLPPLFVQVGADERLLDDSRQFAFVLASETVGLKRVSDFNGAEQDGVSPYPLNVVDEKRVNTGIAYLTEEVRRRPNLTIMGGAEVDTVLHDGRRATGIRLASGETIAAGQVILSAGAYGSPAILMRSGIGPSAHLRALGVPVVVDAPVGERLKEHPFYYNVYALKPEAGAMTPVAGAIIWTNSSEAGPDELDLQLSGTHIFDPAQSPTGGAIVLACAVTLPRSNGSIRLASRDPRVMPLIRFNFFDDPSDLRRMKEAVRLSRRIGRTAPFSDTIAFEIAPGVDVEDDAALEKAILAQVDGYSHPTSTVPMGSDSDPTAVVDRNGAVRGVERLHVVDASIMPDIVSAPTNVTTIMIAEAIAQRL